MEFEYQEHFGNPILRGNIQNKYPPSQVPRFMSALHCPDFDPRWTHEYKIFNFALS